MLLLLLHYYLTSLPFPPDLVRQAKSPPKGEPLGLAKQHFDRMPILSFNQRCQSTEGSIY